jgi:transposase
VLGAVIVAEIGDVRRFGSAGAVVLVGWPDAAHRESDLKLARGHITKQGSPILRWAMIEAIQRLPAPTLIRQCRDAIIARRSKEAGNIAKTAAVTSDWADEPADNWQQR